MGASIWVEGAIAAVIAEMYMTRSIITHMDYSMLAREGWIAS